MTRNIVYHWGHGASQRDSEGDVSELFSRTRGAQHSHRHCSRTGRAAERSGISRSLTIPAGICSADISFEHFPEWHRHSISFRAFSRNGTPFAFLASGHYNSQSYRASRRALLKNRAWFRPIVALADEMNHLVERFLGSVTTDDGRRPPIGCRSSSRMARSAKISSTRPATCLVGSESRSKTR